MEIPPINPLDNLDDRKPEPDDRRPKPKSVEKPGEAGEDEFVPSGPEEADITYKKPSDKLE